MKRNTILLVAIAAAVTSVWLVGCDDDDHGAMHGNNNGSPQIISVSPQDGATGVSTTASISIKFDAPMDTASVMAGFHLSGGQEMQNWMDTLEHHSSMGTMDMDHMMDWMNSIEHSGEFHWNQRMDSCRFVPDSQLMPDTDYMLFMYGDIKGHDGMMMDMHHQDHDGYMYHFRTSP